MVGKCACVCAYVLCFVSSGCLLSCGVCVLFRLSLCLVLCVCVCLIYCTLSYSGWVATIERRCRYVPAAGSLRYSGYAATFQRLSRYDRAVEPLRVIMMNVVVSL